MLTGGVLQKIVFDHVMWCDWGIMDTPDLGRYEASLEAVPLPITARYTTYIVTGA